MTVDRAILVLRERWKIVALCLVLGVLGAGVANYFAPREYSSDITFYVSLQGPAADPDEAYESNELAKERVLSYQPLLTDERITQAVIDRLGLPMTPAELAQRITVSADTDTVVLTAAVRDSTPQRRRHRQHPRRGVRRSRRAARAADRPGAHAGPGCARPARPAGPGALEDRCRDRPPGHTAAHPRVAQHHVQPGAGRGARPADRCRRPGRAGGTGPLGPLGAQLAELAPAPVLAELAHDRHVPSRPLIVDEPFTSPRAEAFRKLRTNLQFRDGRRGHKVIVVTGARMGEGTSTTACNLAIAMAETGHRVLLVDANLRNPRVSDYLGLDPFPGLVDVLAGRMVWQYARQPWNRGGFDVLTAGPYPHNHSQLLASYSLADLFADMRRQYDLVVVDTPALLAVSDAAAVAARADGVVLVVQHQQTSQDQVTAAVGALQAVSARLLGTVLTMTKGRLRREGRVPAYQVPVSTARRDGQPAPTRPRPTAAPPGATPPEAAPPEAAPPEVTSPPTGLPRPIPEQSENNGTQQESGTDTATRPVDKPRPSPTPRR
ncbi:hypothetical protein BJF90_28335 [Pseudonocardia sp. CNS-004]|nr:hypothetical protein BJF90_28335 [Pseudonocardia sp. CNS-004]